MRNRIFAVLAIAILAGGGLAYGTYNMVNKQPRPPRGPHGDASRSWSPPPNLSARRRAESRAT